MKLFHFEVGCQFAPVSPQFMKNAHYDGGSVCAVSTPMTPGEIDEQPDLSLERYYAERTDTATPGKDDDERMVIFLGQCEAIRAVLFLIMHAKNPRRAVYQLLYKCGAGAACGGSAASIAKKFGISREAFEQEADRQFASLGLRKNALEKSAEAAHKYSLSNFRGNKR